MKVLVDSWIPTEDDMIVTMGSVVARVDFDRILPKELKEKANESLYTFFVIRKAFINKFNDKYGEKDKKKNVLLKRGIVHYINYFLKYYDVEKELLAAYLKLKVMIDKEGSRMDKESFSRLMYRVALTETIKDKIIKMTEDNMLIQVKPSNGQRYSEQLTFTDRHLTILMRISVAMKLLLPLILHYCQRRSLPADDVTEFLTPIMEIMSDGVNIYNKLLVTIESRVSRAKKKNQEMFEKHELVGNEDSDFKDTVLRKYIVQGAIPDYLFESSPISYNTAIIDRQSGFYCRKPHGVTMIEIDDKKSSVEGLSGMDKLELHSYKVDESIVVMSKLNVEQILDRLAQKYAFVDIELEVEYYMSHLKITKLHTSLVFYYYAAMFGGYRDLHTTNYIIYLKMMIYLKYELLTSGFVYLPQIISGNISHLNKRVIRNQKFLSKISSSSTYEELVKNRYSGLEELNKKDREVMMSTLINSEFTMVDFNAQDSLGEVIQIDNKDLISDEFMRYQAMI